MNTFFRMTAITATTLLLAAALGLPQAFAKGGDESRSEFTGIVTQRPHGTLQGDWVIGGHGVRTAAGTEFDQADGPLAVGACAKVKIRNGKVHEIDSEPPLSCK